MPIKRMRRFNTAIITLTCLGLAVSGPVLQASAAEAGWKQEDRGDAAPVPAVADVALHSGGTLQGQVVDAQGKPVAEIPVSIRQVDREIRRTVTDRWGRFRVADLRGGVYRISAGKAGGIYRLWAPGTAPASAGPGALVVSRDQKLVLGQCARVIQFLRNPWVVGGIVAVAIALPIAIRNADRDDGPRS